MEEQASPDLRQASTLLPESCITLVDVLRWRASTQAERKAYTFLRDGERDEISLTYAQLDRQARQIGTLLQRDTEVGARILLLYPPGVEYIAAFMGCLYAGMIAVPAYPPSSERSIGRIHAIAADAKIALVLTTTHIVAKTRQWLTKLPELGMLQWIATDDDHAGSEHAYRTFVPERHALTFLQYTSGSTGTPKGVMVSHDNLMHNNAMMYKRWQHSEQSVGVSWLPIFHDMGLIAGVLQPLYAGFPAILLAPAAFIQRPVRWLQAISRYGGTTSCAPNFSYELCVRRVTTEEQALLNLSSWRVAVNGAEPISAETIERFAAKFASCGFRRTAMIPGYGLAEGTLMVSSSQADSGPSIFSLAKKQLAQGHIAEDQAGHDTAQFYVGCGTVAEDQCVVIANPETMTTCQPYEVGEIWIAGPSVTGGYWQRHAETQHVFHAHLADTDKGPFLRTGDLGFLYNGELCISGRLKDIIIIRGRNHYPQDIELTVEKSHPALHLGYGAAFGVEIAHEERLVVVQEVLRNCQETASIFRAIRQAVAEQHELQIYAIVLIRYGSIFKTSSGKIQRRACREAFLNRQLSIVAHEYREETDTVQDEIHLHLQSLVSLSPTLQRQSLQNYLTALLCNVLHIAPIDGHLPITTLGLDSLKAAELQMHIEADLGLSIPFAEILQDATITDLLTRLLQLLPKRNERIEKIETHRSPEQDNTLYTYPLSASQKQLWVVYQLEPLSASYNIPLGANIRGRLHISRLQHSITAIMQRHIPLRTKFHLHNGEVQQYVLSNVQASITHVDLHLLKGDTTSQQKVHLLAKQETDKPFDLIKDIPLRITLFHLGNEEYIFLVVMHHIISDGWSIKLFMHELAHHYTQLSEGENGISPLASLSYAKYVLWQQEWLQGAQMETQLTYWKKQLEHISILNLPTDRPRPAVQSYRGATQHFVLLPTLRQRYKELCTQEGATLFMGILSVFLALLSRYSQQEDICIGTAVANRTRMDIAGTIGCFVNTVVLRTRFQIDSSFHALLACVRTACLAAFQHQELPFTTIVEAVKPERDLSFNPLFQVMFSWQQDIFAGLTLPGATLSPFLPDSSTTKFDLHLDILEHQQTLEGVLSYNTDLFDTSTIQRLIAHFQALLEAIAIDPDQQLSSLSLLTKDEYRQILVEWNKVSSEEPPLLCLHRQFEERVKQNPDAIAVTCGDHSLTYQQLNWRSNQVACYLHTQNIGCGQLVGICLERSIDLLIGLWGVLKTGAAYVPLDPGYPRERLQLMTTTVYLSGILSESSLQVHLQDTSVPVICLDQEWHAIAQQSIHNQDKQIEAKSLVYVIYTSGSTGRPKATGVYQRGFVNLLHWFCSEFALTQHDQCCLVSAISFDLTQKNLFAPLLVGGNIYLLPFEQYDAALIKQHIYERGITLLNCTPSAFYPLVDTRDYIALASLRYVFLGGETIAMPRLWNWQSRSHTEVVNTYGPTECSDVVAFYRLQEPTRFLHTTVPIGRAVSHTALFVLDTTLRLAPIGAISELYISGVCVGSGYLNDTVLTAQKFLPDPFSNLPGRRLYKTGDLVRYREHGNLEFCGRVDHQIKLRGYRIEPGEIEATLNLHPAIQESIVIVHEDESTMQHLVAYIVPAGEGEDTAHRTELTSENIYNYLQGKLAHYMLPTRYIILPSLPLTPSGKVDHTGLPTPDEHNSIKSELFRAPRTTIEDVLTTLWMEVLGRKQISIDENFFALGGHSLLAMQLVIRIRNVFQVDISLKILFELPTIIDQSAYIITKFDNKYTQPILLSTTRPDRIPLSFAQQRIWFLQQIIPGNAAYTTPVVIRLQGTLQPHILHLCLQELVKRHEILRTRFILEHGQAQQVIAPSMTLPLSVIDLQGLNPQIGEAETTRLIHEDEERAFNLAQLPLLRLSLLKIKPQEHILLWTIHHIIFDGWSQNILLHELTTCYNAFSAHTPSPFSILPIQYADFALWQRAWLQGEVLEQLVHYWRKQLLEAPLLKLPTDHPRPANTSYKGNSAFFKLTPHLSQALVQSGQRNGVTLFMTLLTAFQTLLYRYTSQQDIVLGTDIANRSLLETEALIGFFVNILVMRTRFVDNPRFHEVLQQVREMVLGAYMHQDLPFDKLIDVLQIQRKINQLPLINVLFVFQNLPPVTAQTTDMLINSVTVGVNSAKFDLALFMWEEGDHLCGGINYSLDLFEPSTIQQIARQFERLLQCIVEDPMIEVDKIELYTAEERTQLASSDAMYREEQRRKLKITRRQRITLSGHE